MPRNFLSLLLSCSALLAQVFVFVNALLHPEQNVHFIYSVAIMIFFVEFLSIHSSMMMGGASLSGHTTYRYMLLIAYLFFIGMLVMATKSYMPVVFFVLGLIAKTASPARKVVFNLFPVLALFASVFIVMAFSGVLHSKFAMPQEVVAHKPNASGMFVDAPETLLAWGATYYLLLIVGEVWRMTRGGSLPTDMNKDS